MGCGVVADYGHIPAILRTPGLELSALFDPDPGRLRAASEKFGVRAAFADQERFLDEPLDAVVVASPAWAHRDNVLAAAARGLHVLCEKPIAMLDTEAEAMIEAMKAAGRMLLSGFVYRFSPVAQQIRQWIRESAVGEIRSLRLIYIWDLHGRYEMLPNGSWIESPRWVGRMEEGGPLVDCGVHQIDLARWWLGSEVVRSRAFGAWVADYEAPDHVYLHMDHERGEHTAIEVSFTYGHTAREPQAQFSYDLIGSGGVLRYDRNGYILEARTGDGVIRVPGASEKNFPGMYTALAEVLERGAPGDFPTAEDALIATQIARTATDEVIRARIERPKRAK